MSRRALKTTGIEVSHESVYRDPSDALCATVRVHARFPRALRALGEWALELEEQTGGLVGDIQVRRHIGEGARVDVRVRLRFPRPAQPGRAAHLTGDL